MLLFIGGLLIASLRWNWAHADKDTENEHACECRRRQLWRARPRRRYSEPCTSATTPRLSTQRCRYLLLAVKHRRVHLPGSISSVHESQASSRMLGRLWNEASSTVLWTWSITGFRKVSSRVLHSCS